MTVVWTARAVRQLVALRSPIARRSEENASLVAVRIIEAVELLRNQPERGRPGRIPGTRELVVPHTPYLVPYRVRKGRIELIAILDGRQKWPSHL